jgi:putative transposase
MSYNPEIHHRRSIRLHGYDYTRAGAYFITICTHQRLCLFGEVIDGKIQLNPIGQLIVSLWQRIPQHFPNVELDEFVLMPNHLHGIIIIVKQQPQPNSANQELNLQGTKSNSLGAIIQNFKSISTRKIKRINHNSSMLIWQRNYYEQIIRDDRTLQKIRQYITDNPLNWESDRLTPNLP